MKKIAVYGSLRRGFFNHSKDDMGDMVGVSTIPGDMRIVYSYPHLYLPSASESRLVRNHVVELYEIDDDLYNAIEAMEIGAGYKVVHTTLIDTITGLPHDVIVFYTRDEYIGTDSGIWVPEYSHEMIDTLNKIRNKIRG